MLPFMIGILIFIQHHCLCKSIYPPVFWYWFTSTIPSVLTKDSLLNLKILSPRLLFLTVLWDLVPTTIVESGTLLPTHSINRLNSSDNSATCSCFQIFLERSGTSFLVLSRSHFCASFRKILSDFQLSYWSLATSWTAFCVWLILLVATLLVTP